MVQIRLLVLLLTITFKGNFSSGEDHNQRVDRSSNNICTNKVPLPDSSDEENSEIFYCADVGFCCELQEWRPIQKYCHICTDNTYCCPQIYCCHEGDPKTPKARIATADPKKDSLGDTNRVGSYYVYLVLGIGVVLVIIICVNEWAIAKKRQRTRIHAESEGGIPSFERMHPLPDFLSTNPNGDYLAGNFGNGLAGNFGNNSAGNFGNGSAGNFGNNSAGNFQERRSLTPPPPYSP